MHMLKEGRLGLTDEHKVQLWRMWKVGFSTREISRTVSRGTNAVRIQLRERGGITPPVRRRAANALPI